MGVGTAQWFYNLAAWSERWRMPRAFTDLCLQVANEVDVQEGILPATEEPCACPLVCADHMNAKHRGYCREARSDYRRSQR